MVIESTGSEPIVSAPMLTEPVAGGIGARPGARDDVEAGDV
jgi:hypothetical protein